MHFCRMSALYYLANQLVWINYKKTSDISLFYLRIQEMVILIQLPWPESFKETKERSLISEVPLLEPHRQDFIIQTF